MFYCTSHPARLQQVQIPALCMGARNDPIIHESLTFLSEAAAHKNPNLVVAITKEGGHLGWLEGKGKGKGIAACTASCCVRGCRGRALRHGAGLVF